MSEPLNSLPPASFKTSLTHPIKSVFLPLLTYEPFITSSPSISLMIPPEIIALISSHALLSFSAYPKNSPTLLDIPSPFTLTRYPDLCDVRPQNGQISAKPMLLAKQPIDDPFCARPNIADALQAAITTGIDPILDHPVNDQKHNPERVPFGNRVFIPKTSLSLSVSMNIPTSATFHTSPITPFSDTPQTKLHNLLSPLNGTLKHIPPPSVKDPGQSALSFSTWVSESSHRTSSPYSATSPSYFAIGNLFLSSCPGKKGILHLHIHISQRHSFLYTLVRLDGSIKGRIGVRRDLETDMRRIKDMGTGCIIWCDLICHLPASSFSHSYWTTVA